jgi:hypothetical protein
VGNNDDFNGRSYSYEGSGHSHAQPHAVTSADSNTFAYDHAYPLAGCLQPVADRNREVQPGMEAGVVC